MPDSTVVIRPALDSDRVPMATLFAAVAEERDGIATEPPVDVEARAAGWLLDGTLVAVAGGGVGAADEDFDGGGDELAEFLG